MKEKKKGGLFKKIAIGFIALVVLGAVFGSQNNTSNPSSSAVSNNNNQPTSSQIENAESEVISDNSHTDSSSSFLTVEELQPSFDEIEKITYNHLRTNSFFTSPFFDAYVISDYSSSTSTFSISIDGFDFNTTDIQTIKTNLAVIQEELNDIIPYPVQRYDFTVYDRSSIVGIVYFDTDTNIWKILANGKTTEI